MPEPAPEILLQQQMLGRIDTVVPDIRHLVPQGPQPDAAEAAIGGFDMGVQNVG